MADNAPIWKVLIVEDEAQVAEEVSNHLAQMGHEVIDVVDSTEEAVDRARRLGPDIVLMNICTEGEMSSIDAANHIFGRLGIPTIFSTSHSDSDTLKQAQIGNRYGYIAKPIREQDLVLSLQMTMHRHQSKTETLRQVEMDFRKLIENAPSAVVVCNADEEIIWVNAKTQKMFGHARETLLGKPMQTLMPEHLHSMFKKFMEDYRASPRTLRADHDSGFYGLRADETRFPIEFTVNAVEAEDGQTSLSFIIRDITSLKSKQALAWNRANFDALTGLPNRYYFQQCLSESVRDSASTGQPLALLFLDLDNFKEINDTQGHSMGDRVLVAVANRMRSLIRESDTLARLGGDEFTLISPRLQNELSVSQLARHLLHELSRPFDVEGNRFFITASIGIAIFPDNTCSEDDLLKFADQAMYSAKLSGRNQYAYFSLDMQKEVQEKYALIEALQRALYNEEFFIHFQPIVEVKTRKVTKADALLGWGNAKYGNISPIKFMPLLEETGLIHEVGEWVFDSCVRFARKLEKKLDRAIRIGVPIPAAQLARAGRHGVDWDKKLADEPGLAKFIDIAITESLLANDTQEVNRSLRTFHEHGVTLSIDGFGTGLSSLSFLKRFDIDCLKIDASFIRCIENNQDDHVLTEVVIAMAGKLGMKVIAEGIETSRQFEILQNLGCDYVQGRLFSNPLPAAQFEDMLVSIGDEHGSFASRWPSGIG